MCINEPIVMVVTKGEGLGVRQKKGDLQRQAHMGRHFVTKMLKFSFV